jgi:hypothetical protein
MADDMPPLWGSWFVYFNTGASLALAAMFFKIK